MGICPDCGRIYAGTVDPRGERYYGLKKSAASRETNLT
jgi:hypothetical protein